MAAPTPQEFERILRGILADRHVSRQERRTLSDLVDIGGADARALDVYRGVAFRLAREAVENPGVGAPATASAGIAAGEVLDWLEAVLKALRSPAEAHQPVCEAYFSPGDHCPRRIIELLNAARTSLDLCVYTITDDRIARAVLDAHGRGIAVRVLSDCEKCEDLGADVEELRQRGIAVKLNRPGSGRMHHKFGLFDRRLLLTGSYNWTRAAAGMNYENVVVLDAPALVARFAEEFEMLWKAL